METTKIYYIFNGNIKKGPFTLDQLKEETLTQSTLIWYDGLADWTNVYNVEEIKEIIIKTPPPIKVPPSLTHYNSYQEHEDVAFVGYLLIAFNILLIIFNIIKGNDKDWIKIYNEYRPIFLMFSSLIKISIVYWVVKIAKRQNRNQLGWGVFAFFIPSICLIILGKLKKIRIKKYVK